MGNMKKKYVIKEFKSEKEIHDIIYFCEHDKGRNCIGWNGNMADMLREGNNTLKLWRIDGNRDSCKVGELYYNKITRSIDDEWTWCSEWFDDSYKIDPVSEELFTI